MILFTNKKQSTMKILVLLIYSILCTFFMILFYHSNRESDKHFNLRNITKIEFPSYNESHRTIKKYYRTGDYSVTIRYYVINKDDMKNLQKRLNKETNKPDSKWNKDLKRYIFEQEKSDDEYFKVIIEENSDKYFDVEYGRQKYSPFRYKKGVCQN